MAVFDVKEKKSEKNNLAHGRSGKSFVRRENRTGIPTVLKERMEQSTGLSFDDVRVNYNSKMPAKLDALAYTQGNRVEIGPGQERYLPHELGHVVQQKLGLVRANERHSSGALLNTDAGLERQADEIGAGKRINIVQRKESNVVQRGKTKGLTGRDRKRINDKKVRAEKANRRARQIRITQDDMQFLSGTRFHDLTSYLPSGQEPTDGVWDTVAHDVSGRALDEHIADMRSKKIVTPHGKKYEPTMVAMAIDLDGGHGYLGYSGETGFNPSRNEIVESLQDDLRNTEAAARMQNATNEFGHYSFEDWNVGNCAEVHAVNNALRAGAKKTRLHLRVKRYSTGRDVRKCGNCQRTFPNL